MAIISVAACIALVLLSMGSPATADVQDDCRVTCIPFSNSFASTFCRSLIDSIPLLDLDSLYTTCKVRLSAEVTHLCIDICSLNTLTPVAHMPAPASAPAPPCKQY
jgi:hypothetical protein